MMKTNNGKYSFLLSYVDMLFAIMLAIMTIYILNIILITTKKDDKKIDSKAEFMITMTWDDHSAHDIDLWVLTPENQKVGFSSKQNSYMNLERDDLGFTNDMTRSNDRDHPYKLIYLNKEVATIRAIRSGKYVVNVHFYDQKPDPLTHETDMNPVPVKIELIKLNPTVTISASVEVTLTKKWEQRTAFSFEVQNDGTVTNIQQEQIPFILNRSSPGRIGSPYGQYPGIGYGSGL